MVGFTVGIGQYHEGPLVPLLIVGKPLRLREGHDHDGNSPFIESVLFTLHLYEVFPASESAEVAEKDEEHELLHMGF